MPIPSTQTVEQPAKKLNQWWLGQVVLYEENGKIIAITSAKLGDENGVSSLQPIDLRSMDLAGEFKTDMEALIAVKTVIEGINIIAAKLMDLRGLR